MNKSVKFKTWGLIYLIIVMLAFSVALTARRFFHYNFLIASGLILVLAAPIAFVLFTVFLSREKNKPYSRIYSEFRKELFMNGYTEMFFELSDKAISAYKNGEKIDIVYLKDFVLYTADYYNATEQYDKALSLIMLLDENEFTKKSMTFIDYGMSAVLYYGCLMETYRGLNDKENAIRMIDRAKPFLDMDFKYEALGMTAETVYYNYYMIIENYDRAREYAERLISHNSPGTEKFISRYYVEAEYDLHLGLKQDAVNALRKIEPLMKGESEKLMSFYYLRFQERLGLKEEMERS